MQTWGPLPETTRAELEQKHGEILVFETKWGELAFRCPMMEEVDIYEQSNWEGIGQAVAQKKATRTQMQTQRTLCNSCLLFPGLDVVKELFQLRPNFIKFCATEIASLAGREEEIRIKKG